MNGPRECHTEWSKSGRERYDIACVWNLKKKKNDTNELIYKAEVESQMWNTTYDYQGMVAGG